VDIFPVLQLTIEKVWSSGCLIVVNGDLVRPDGFLEPSAIRSFTT